MAKKQVPARQDKQLPAVSAQQYQQDANAGFDEATREAFAIPFLAILQAGSPQVKKSDGKYIKGAVEGMIFNTVTQQAKSGDEDEEDSGVIVIPVYFQQRFTRWGPRDSGGGFKGEYLSTDPEVARAKGEGGVDAGKSAMRFLPDDKGRYDKKTSDVINDTRNHYVLIEGPDGQLSPAVVSMTSTQIRASRNWMSKMRGFTANDADGKPFILPMYAHRFRLLTTPEQNDKGSWYGWKVELVGSVDPSSAEYAAARALAHSISTGAVKATPQNEPNDDFTNE